ncbi:MULTISPECIES: oleate hydratase [Enterococcaceae]|uniref:oleate hydratase n=1 Tax=Enterococcaceae TaxID=81852 RepID=UPI000E54DBE3|nr:MULTISPECIES: oleate hydratase [Enterococcaceae]MCI0130198.1 oleate hydratase [Vagococcus sp. CY53-2]RGI31058.1 oleate hydratase [Melissococcus sp. OM08-11BH]UNM89020.1 oleate hydratase [Vagococcus sp. CY52-2]
MYTSNGNYEAFARPKKPERTDKISAVYLVGSGLASLSAAAFLIRDAQLPGNKITILEELPLPGGSLDGIDKDHYGFVIRGGREMENHFECLWDLYRSVPSLEVENASVLDEFYWLNKEDPNSSECRLIHSQGIQSDTDGKFTLTEKGLKEIISLCLTKEDDLQDKRIDEVFSQEFFDSNFWKYWCTMFAFENWHSAMEMRRYLMRFVHHIDGLADFSALKFTKYNQYESLVMPLVDYLTEQGVTVQYNTKVDNIIVNCSNNQKIAEKLELIVDGKEQTIELKEDDLVFVTNGSITESSTYGTQTTPAPIPSTEDLGGSWNLWKKLAEQCDEFGHPEKFCENLPSESWVISATITTLDKKIAPYLENISKRDPYSGRVVTGGIVYSEDSNWRQSYTINRQPHFKKQPKDELVIWFYALCSNKDGNYVKKPITSCTGEEIAKEWLYHIGVPVDKIDDLAKNSVNVIPTYMPFITSYFMPRANGDRPLVVPNGSKNLAFIGNFAETKRDTVFTTEYSVRTAMEAVYELMDVDRGVPEVFASAFDIRTLLRATYYLTDKKTLPEIKVPWLMSKVEKHELKKIQGTFVEELLKDNHLL